MSNFRRICAADAFLTRSLLTRISAMVFQSSFAVFLSTMVGTISGGTALQRASSAIISSCSSMPPFSTMFQSDLAFNFTFISSAQSE